MLGCSVILESIWPKSFDENQIWKCANCTQLPIPGEIVCRSGSQSSTLESTTCTMLLPGGQQEMAGPSIPRPIEAWSSDSQLVEGKGASHPAHQEYAQILAKRKKLKCTLCQRALCAITETVYINGKHFYHCISLVMYQLPIRNVVIQHSILTLYTFWNQSQVFSYLYSSAIS